MSNSITNARKPSFMLSCLAIITEGMRSVFETAVGGDKVFYKIFVGYQYMDYGYIISYNNAIHNLTEYSINDAIKYLIFKGLESMRCMSSDTEESDSFSQILHQTYRNKMNKFIISKPIIIKCNAFGSVQHFILSCMINTNEWPDSKIPLNLIENYFDHIGQMNDFFPCTFSVSKKVGDHIYANINSTTIVSNVCEMELRERFGKNRKQKPGELFGFICNLACKPYEGAQNKGIIRFATDNFEKNAYIKFESNVSCSMQNVREIRKLLEMTDEENPLIVKKYEAVGIGTAGAGEYFIKFEGNGKWKLCRKDKGPLFTVEGNVCSFIRSIDTDDFRKKFIHLFPSYANFFPQISKIVEAAKEQKHGTSIIISDKAEEESTRLCKKKRAIRIQKYVFFDRSITDKAQEKIIKKFTSIDGALIISPDGVCYAIGVILDGKAVENGDTGRGARYNSLNNYVSWAKEEKDIKAISMAIVISEDQTIDCLPKKMSLDKHDDTYAENPKVYPTQSMEIEGFGEELPGSITSMELLHPESR